MPRSQCRRTMRIKAVLRDNEILKMEKGSKRRIQATAKKNLDRAVSLSSLLKVMGLEPGDRARMLESMSDSKMHIWLFNSGEQDIILLCESRTPDLEEQGYRWQ
jgi:hypothetical protein